jgi:hypothetical protein
MHNLISLIHIDLDTYLFSLFIYFLEKRTSPQQIIAQTPVNQIDQLKASPPAKKTVQRRVINGSPLQQQHKGERTL